MSRCSRVAVLVVVASQGSRHGLLVLFALEPTFHLLFTLLGVVIFSLFVGVVHLLCWVVVSFMAEMLVWQ